MVNSLCQSVEILFINNTNVTKGVLNKSELHQNSVNTKVLVNDVYKVVSQWLTGVCEVKKVSKKEDVSNFNSYKDLEIEKNWQALQANKKIKAVMHFKT